MDTAVAVVVVADGAIEQVIGKNAVERFTLSGIGACGSGNDLHTCLYGAAAGAYQIAVNLDHTGVTGLDRAKLVMVADLRQLHLDAVNCLDQQLARGDADRHSVDNDCFCRGRRRGQ